MLKNIKKILKKFVCNIVKVLPLKKIILFESRPDFACNTYPVFLLLASKKELKHYKLVWITHDNTKLKNVKTMPSVPKCIVNKIKKLYYIERACCVVSCNELLYKRSQKQISVFLSHGSKTKKTRGMYEIGKGADYVLVQSHFFDDIIKYEYNLSQDQLVYCGYPRCDYFYNCNKDILSYFNCVGRYIIWLPTFRKNTSRSVDDAISSYNNIGMPVIYSNKQLKELNSFLQARNLYIIYKPHPAQDVSVLKALTMTNILILNDTILFDKKLQLYEVIAKSSALITDYSSVYFDYLLLNRPIATTCDDAEEWKNGRGFAFDLETIYNNTTVRVNTFKDLTLFIDDIYNNIDNKGNERNKVKNITNIYDDGHSSERVAEFIISKLKERKYL